jgi:DNA-binding response OmpR family regulator
MSDPARIFLVEDHAATARALKMFLEAKGYRVSVAGDVASALAYANSNMFDLLICDLGLPDGTGWDLMKKLSAFGAIRGIAFTASGSDDDIARSKRVGFLRHVMKGSSADELVDVIEQTLAVPLPAKAQPSRRVKAKAQSGTE